MSLEDLFWTAYTYCRSLRIHNGISNISVFANEFATGSFACQQRLLHKSLTLEVQGETLPRSIIRFLFQEFVGAYKVSQNATIIRK
jgi:hypothetical protein